MGVLSGLLGHASEIDVKALEKEFEAILTDGETIERAFKVIRDLIVFTNKRLVLVNKQGMTGKKVEYHSVPYRAVTHFSVETAGRLDLDAELKIYITGSPEPIRKEFKKDANIYDIQKSLAGHILKQ